MWCDSHSGQQQQILGFLCPLHRFKNACHCPPLKLLLFRVTNWNDQSTLCSTPHSQINRTMQFFNSPYIVYIIYSAHYFRYDYLWVPNSQQYPDSYMPNYLTEQVNRGRESGFKFMLISTPYLNCVLLQKHWPIPIPINSASDKPCWGSVFRQTL